MDPEDVRSGGKDNKMDKGGFIVMGASTHESGFNVLSRTHGNGSNSLFLWLFEV